MIRLKCGLLILSTLALTSCYTGSSPDSLRQAVSDVGVSAEVWGNLPYGSTEAQVAASVYRDGEKKALVGGDVVKAYSESSSAILRSIENLGGDYVAGLSVINRGAGVDFEVEHDPQGAREDRWYPTEELLVDPGPGELVGYNAQLDFPEPLILSDPADGTRYANRSDAITLNWTADPNAEQMRLTAVLTCNSESRSVSWARSQIIDNTGDPGTFSLTVGDLIPNTGLLTTVVDAVSQLSVIIASAIVSQYTYGLINPDPVQVESFAVTDCDISLTLFREVSGTLGDGITGGFAVASSSATINLVYEPL